MTVLTDVLDRKRYSKDKTQGTKAAIDQHSRDLTATVKSFENKEKQVQTISVFFSGIQ